MAKSHPLRLSEDALQAEFGLIAPLLASHGFIQRLDDSTEAECPGAANACLKTVAPRQGRFYFNCDCEEGVGLIEVSKSCLRRVQFDLKSLLEWMAKGLTLSGSVEPVRDSESWFLGKDRGGAVRHYFLRSDSHREAIRFGESLLQDRPVVYWLGQRPHTGTFPKNLIPLEEVIEPRKASFILNRKILSKSAPSVRHAIGGKAIILDQHIGMEKEGDIPYLFFERDGGTFQHKKRIRPQAFGLIQFLYTIRNKKENAFKLEEFVVREFVSAKRTASARIAEINGICASFEAKPIFHKFPEDKWGLNPNLGRAER